MTEAPGGEILLVQRELDPQGNCSGFPNSSPGGHTAGRTDPQVPQAERDPRRHNIYDEDEVEETATCQDFRQVRTEETRQVNRSIPPYNDDLVASAEFRAQDHEPTYMADWLAHLDRLVTAMDAPTVTDAGSVSRKQAVGKAETEYDKYRIQMDEAPSEVEKAYLETIKRTQGQIEGKQE